MAHLDTRSALADMTRANIGFVLSHEQFPANELMELGPRAEQAGFDTVWASDHFHPWMDNQGHAGLAWLTLAAVGARTQRVPFGTGVTCPTYRYPPAIVAQGFATLGVMFPGRVYLGAGTGEALNEIPAGGGWGTYKERAARLVEAIHVIRELWSGEVVNHRGDYYQVEGARLYDVPGVPVPIYIAAYGPKSARLAGEHGDGLIADSKSALMPEIRDAFAEGAHAAGKDPDAMPIIAEHWICTGDRAEAEKGAALWRFIPRGLTSYINDPDPRSIQRRAEAEIGIDEVLEVFTISTDPDEHVQTLQKLLDGGVTTLYVHSAQADQNAVIEFYGQHVLPHIRKERLAAQGAATST